MRAIFAALLLFFASPAFGQDRLALVIGNDAYSDVPALLKAVADADAVASTLTDQGYSVFKSTNVGRRAMNRTISEFTNALEPGDTAVVFYAGHGVEIQGENYLLPTDIVAPSAGDADFVRSESIGLSDLLDRVRATGARMSIAIIDACRDNPFPASNGRSIGTSRGLGRIAAPEGTFVIFSAGAGQTALDRLSDTEDDPNSVFTRALLPRLSEPGLELREMVAGLRRDVLALAKTVQHTQVPAYYDELLGEFFFTTSVGATPAPNPEPMPAPEIDDMRADFELARSLGSATALDAFLERYSDQSDALAYQLALALRQDLEDPPAPVAERPRTAIIRETQSALNALGCAAGPADGIAGSKTRQAFAAFLTETGVGLRSEDLGSEAALEAIQAETGPTCRPTTAPTPKTGGPTLAGTWTFKANCALFISTTGSVSLRETVPGRFQGTVRDSLGQTGRVEMALNGLAFSGQTFFPAVTHSFTGTLAEDGRRYTHKGTSTCTVNGVRVN